MIKKDRFMVRHPNGELLDDTISPTEHQTMFKAVGQKGPWQNYVKEWEDVYYRAGYRISPVTVTIERREIDG